MTKRGDLLFTRYNGSPDFVGVCGRFTSDQPVAYPDKLMAAQPVHQDEVIGSFLELACNAGESRRFIEQNTKTTAGQHGVSGETIKAVPIPVPPKQEMAEIMRQVQLALMEQTTATSDMSGFSDGAASLRQSILAAAFRGELAA